jgi:hypothetical protein
MKGVTKKVLGILAILLGIGTVGWIQFMHPVLTMAQRYSTYWPFGVGAIVCIIIGLGFLMYDRGGNSTKVNDATIK